MLRALAVLPVLFFCGSAAALDFRWKALDVTLDSEFSLGTVVRAQEPSPQRIGLANGGAALSTNRDDGNLAFGRGEAVSMASQWVSELSIGLGGFGLFASGRYLIDPVLDGARLYDSADYLPNPGKELGLDELRRKQEAVRESQARQSDLLEAYLSAGMNLGRHPLSLKLGRQSLDWGEALRLTNGLSSLLALDQTRLRGAGHSIEEAVIPAGMLRLSAGLMRNLTADGFYQYEWRPNIEEAAGTFFSVNDYLGAGGTQFNLGFGQVNENTAAGMLFRNPLLPVLGCFTPAAPLPTLVDCAPLGSTIPRAPDVRPRDRSQYGGALELAIPALNHMELALYGARYHSRLPVLSGISRLNAASSADSAAYFVEYPEDLRLWGLSFSSPLRALNGTLHGELSRKDGQPLQIDDIELVQAMLGEASQINPVAGATLGNQIIPGWRRHTVSQWTLGLTRAFGPRFGYDLLTFELEASGAHVRKLPPENVLRYEGPGTDTPGDAAAALMQGVPQQQGGYATASSWGYRAQLKPSFFNVAGALGFDLILRYAHDVAGITPAPLTDFVKGRREASMLLDFSYLEAWGFELGYTAYSGARNLLADRDFYEARITRSF